MSGGTLEPPPMRVLIKDTSYSSLFSNARLTTWGKQFNIRRSGWQSRTFLIRRWIPTRTAFNDGCIVRVFTNELGVCVPGRKCKRGDQDRTFCPWRILKEFMHHYCNDSLNLIAYGVQNHRIGHKHSVICSYPQIMFSYLILNITIHTNEGFWSWSYCMALTFNSFPLLKVLQCRWYEVDFLAYRFPSPDNIQTFFVHSFIQNVASVCVVTKLRFILGNLFSLVKLSSHAAVKLSCLSSLC